MLAPFGLKAIWLFLGIRGNCNRERLPPEMGYPTPTRGSEESCGTLSGVHAAIGTPDHGRQERSTSWRYFLGAKNAREMPWAQLRNEHVWAIRTKLGERYKPASASKYLSAVEGAVREPWRLGEFAGEELEKVREFAPFLDPRCQQAEL